MPCYDKKLEASRPDFADANKVRDVDCVLTTGEVVKVFEDHGCDVYALAEAIRNEESMSEMKVQGPERPFPSLLGHPGSTSGSYLFNVIQYLIEATPEDRRSSLQLEVKTIRTSDYVDFILTSPSPPTDLTPEFETSSANRQVLFRGAVCYGFRNLQNVVRKIGKEQNIVVTRGAAASLSNGTSGPSRPIRGPRRDDPKRSTGRVRCPYARGTQ